jgi:hypothetical protein
MEVGALSHDCDGDVGWVFGFDFCDDFEYDEDDWYPGWETYRDYCEFEERIEFDDKYEYEARIEFDDKYELEDEIDFGDTCESEDKIGFVDKNEFEDKIGLVGKIGA